MQGSLDPALAWLMKRLQRAPRAARRSDTELTHSGAPAMKLARIGAFAAFAAALIAGAVLTFLPPSTIARAKTSAEVANMHFAPYEPQKVIYHVTDGEGLFERKWKNLLHVARNHVDAVGPGDLDLRIVLQGGAVEMLSRALSDQRLAREIDGLKKEGVRFIICRNTLMLRGIDPISLHGVKREDIVASTVAEAAKLAAAGYVYLKF
jgi:hypothetical protein